MYTAYKTWFVTVVASLGILMSQHAWADVTQSQGPSRHETRSPNAPTRFANDSFKLTKRHGSIDSDLPLTGPTSEDLSIYVWLLSIENKAGRSRDDQPFKLFDFVLDTEVHGDQQNLTIGLGGPPLNIQPGEKKNMHSAWRKLYEVHYPGLCDDVDTITPLEIAFDHQLTGIPTSEQLNNGAAPYVETIFQAVDDQTVDGLGGWDFHYQQEIKDDDAGIASILHMRGLVYVTCAP